MAGTRKIATLLAAALILFNNAFAAFAADISRDDAAGKGASAKSTEIAMRFSSAGFTCEGREYASPAPLIVDGTVFLPLRAVAEAFGAGIGYSESASSDNESASSVNESAATKKISGSFISNDFQFIVGADHYTVNGVNYDFPERIRIVGETAYVPARVLDRCLGTSTAFDDTAGTLTIRLDDDGSIDDLSELLGEIREPAIGDSYFKWQIDAPKKTILVSSSFNGDKTVLYNPAKKIYLEISVEPGRGHPPEYYEANPDEFFDEFEVESVQVVGTGSSRYAQAVASEYGAAAMMRLYVRSRYDYRVTLIIGMDDYDDEYYDADVFSGSNPYAKILDSFKVQGFSPEDQNIRDIAKIKNDRLHYPHYIKIPESKSNLNPWAVTIFPAWEILYDSSGPYIATVMGKDADENLKIEICLPARDTAAEYYQKFFAELETAGYSRDLLSLDDYRIFELSGRKIFEFTYTVDEGEKGGGYKYCERLIPCGEVQYRLRLKTAKRKYDINREAYADILDSFEIRDGSSKRIYDILARQASELKKMRVSKGDDRGAVGNPTFNWNSSLPGGWIKQKAFTAYYMLLGEEFYDPASGAVISMKYDLLRSDWDAYARNNVKQMNGVVKSGPEQKKYGDNAYSSYAYVRERGRDEYYSRFPGTRINGRLYIYSGDLYAYIITVEIPRICDIPANAKGIEMFLTEFRLTKKSDIPEKSGGGDVNAADAAAKRRDPIKVEAVG